MDDLEARLGSAMARGLQGQARTVAELRTRLRRATPETRIQSESQRLLSLWKRLQAASPQSVLNRGFVIVRDAAGQPLERADKLRAGQEVSAQFADGSQVLRVLE